MTLAIELEGVSKVFGDVSALDAAQARKKAQVLRPGQVVVQEVVL